MQINEVTQRVDLSKRAIKYYEEQGLLTVAKDSNGYRNYSEEDIAVLKEISVYRKLGIGIHDIRTLLKTRDRQMLENIYKEKAAGLEQQQGELEALRTFIRDNDVDAIYKSIDYKTIGQALQDMVPGFYGYYFMNHFMPYLQIPITTQAQADAYHNILEFWDNTNIRPPLFMRFVSYLIYRLTPKPSQARMIAQMDATLQRCLHPTEEEYEKLKKQTAQGVKMKNSLLYKYHPAYVSQRKFMKRLQDQGYNDIFIPNMIALSPPYKEYHDALMKINERICSDLGLYYDTNYNLVMKNK